MEPKNEITVDGVKYIRADLLVDACVNGLDYVIVRGRDAGCHAGYLVDSDDETRVAYLAQGRRLWRWHGRTLTGLALEGTDNASLCKFGDPLGSRDKPHRVGGWSEILPCTEQARQSLEGVARWEND